MDLSVLKLDDEKLVINLDIPNVDDENKTCDIININLLSEKIDYLLKLREQYKLNSATNLDSTIEKLEKIFLQNEDSLMKENKLLYWYKLGQLYSLSSKTKSKSIEPLSKAVKLDPTLVDVWNELGEGYWHNNEAELAQKCFENALVHERKKLPLRNLSIVLRKRAIEPKNDKKAYLEKGIELAKEAVNLDIKDGLSWGILGNAYLSVYFGVKQDIKYAKMALSAYKQAEKLPFAMLNAELHYNKAFASKYSEMYEDTLLSLDRSLEIEGTWEPAVRLRTELLKYLDSVMTLYSNKGKLKPKRIAAMTKELATIQEDPSFRMYAGEILVPFNKLKDGANNRVVVFGKVIWNLCPEESFPFTFGYIDSFGNTIVVTVYNMTPGRGFIIGDSIKIPDPLVVVTNFDYKNKKYCFKTIRVDSPAELIVNKRRLPPAWYTAYTLLTKDKDELDKVHKGSNF
ncbi:hypothetical protein O3M35_003821 [Rhynocoris fuscipes]|uniref:Tetratricopeptide repeat protein 5 OB fold domain-containing protein n=1 Tax=Rhynocoris fuscipes TaxID=488301 RepID=A0AAW1CGK3_9HEMI